MCDPRTSVFSPRMGYGTVRFARVTTIFDSSDCGSGSRSACGSTSWNLLHSA